MKKRVKEFVFLLGFGIVAELIIYGINSGLQRLGVYKDSKLVDFIDEMLPIGLIVYISLVYFRPIPEGDTLKSRKKKLVFRITLAVIILVLLKYLTIYLN